MRGWGVCESGAVSSTRRCMLSASCRHLDLRRLGCLSNTWCKLGPTVSGTGRQVASKEQHVSTVEIRGAQHPIHKIFSDDFAFFVPSYQRPYSWTNEHAGELLDDLLAFLGDGQEKVDDLNPYFLGSIVLIKGDAPEAQIVDGQQRLTTLTILLAALRELVGPQYAQAITPFLYGQGNTLTGAPDRYRLSLRERDSAFFQENLQHVGGVSKLPGLNAAKLSDSQRYIRENALMYLDRLRALPDLQRVRLAQFIVRRCLLVVVSTPDLDSAYRIFSVLNDRGLDLSPADILKAEVIGRVPPGLQAAYTAKWEGLEDELGREDFDGVLSHIRTLYRRRWQRGPVLSEFRNYVMATVGDSQRLIDDTLLPLGEAYRVIRDEDYEHPQAQIADEINGYLRWLNRLPESDWIPPAMLYLVKYGNAPERLVRFFADLERLAAGLLIRRSPINKRFDRFNRLIQAIERGDNLGALDSPLQLAAEDRKIALGVLDGNFYLNYSRARQYVLLRLDSALAEGEASYNFKTISVEHVLPQNPPVDSAWTQSFAPEVRDQWVHRLGNLVLLSRAKNSLANNYDFERKKRVYFAGPRGISPFALTTQVVRETEWTPEVVERRQRELIAKLRDLWKL